MKSLKAGTEDPGEHLVTGICGKSGIGGTTEGVENLWIEMAAGRDGSYREVWRALTEAVGGTAGRVSLLRAFEAALESQGREIVRAAYWRGYHAGYREAAGDMLPAYGQAEEPRERENQRLRGARSEPPIRARTGRESSGSDA